MTMQESLLVRKLMAEGRFAEASAILNSDDDDDAYDCDPCANDDDEPDDDQFVRFLDGE